MQILKNVHGGLGRLLRRLQEPEQSKQLFVSCKSSTTAGAGAAPAVVYVGS